MLTRDRKNTYEARAGNLRQGMETRKLEDPIHYKGLKKDYVGDMSVLVLVCGDTRTNQVI